MKEGGGRKGKGQERQAEEFCRSVEIFEVTWILVYMSKLHFKQCIINK